MPWTEVSIVSARREFVEMAISEGGCVRALCRRFGVSPKTGYKWIARYCRDGPVGLQDRSRRPHRSPGRMDPGTEEAVLQVRDAHPAWGGRKIRARLLAGQVPRVPSPSTITEILRRHGRLDPAESTKHKAFQRFEAPRPNALWQMDFKGHFGLAKGRCHPLTVLDDHSRFAIGLQACGDEKGETVQGRLTGIFERYGLPERMLADNGPPWGTGTPSEHTQLTVWLMRLGVGVIHGRPYHPQTQGKDERFHRTLSAEVLRYERLETLADCQRAFDGWREVYNFERPHDALEMATPATRYQPSPRAFGGGLPAINYGPDDVVRKVQAKGELHYGGRTFPVGRGFRGHPVALRPTAEDGVWDVFFCHQRIAQIDQRTPSGSEG